MKTTRLARRMESLGTETAFEVLNRARQLEAQGRSVIHLEIGEPDFPTPPNVQQAAVKAMRDGFTHYVSPQGIPQVREAIAEYIGKTRNIEVHPDEVVVVPGGKPIMYFLMTALLEQGDEVIYPDPGFPIYESMARFLGARRVPIALREDLEFRMDIAEVEAAITDRTRLIVVNSPHNPTGGVMTQQDVQRLARALADRDVLVLSDEIYSRILFEGSHYSIASEPGMRERTVILDGFSKTYAMTGWRLGYGVMPRDLAVAISRLLVNSVSCTSAFSQMAGIEALRGDQSAVDAMIEEFRRRRDFFVKRANEIPGVRCLLPHGAFYTFPSVTGIGYSSRELERRLLDEAGVAALAGTAFGAAGEGYLRFSVANSLENIAQALDRVHDWVRKNRRSSAA
jgi:aspartate aminotransferase